MAAPLPPEPNAFLFEQMMRKSGSERLIIGSRMTGSACQLVWSGISPNFPEVERRTLFLQRFCGSGI